MSLIVLNLTKNITSYLGNMPQFIYYYTSIINIVHGEPYVYHRWDKYTDADGNIHSSYYPKDDTAFMGRKYIKEAIKRGDDILLNVNFKHTLSSVWDIHIPHKNINYPTAKPYKLLKRVIQLSTV